MTTELLLTTNDGIFERSSCGWSFEKGKFLHKAMNFNRILAKLDLKSTLVITIHFIIQGILYQQLTEKNRKMQR